jgi:hypothetical protein
VLFLTLTLLCAFAYFAPANSLRAVAAQSPSPSGTFGFLANASQIDSNGSNGGAFLGVLTFDGVSNVYKSEFAAPCPTEQFGWCAGAVYSYSQLVSTKTCSAAHSG